MLVLFHKSQIILKKQYRGIDPTPYFFSRLQCFIVVSMQQRTLENTSMVFTCIMPANVTHLNDCLLEAILHYGSCMLQEHPFRVRRSIAVAFLNLST